MVQSKRMFHSQLTQSKGNIEISSARAARLRERWLKTSPSHKNHISYSVADIMAPIGTLPWAVPEYFLAAVVEIATSRKKPDVPRHQQKDKSSTFLNCIDPTRSTMQGKGTTSAQETNRPAPTRTGRCLVQEETGKKKTKKKQTVYMLEPFLYFSKENPLLLRPLNLGTVCTARETQEQRGRKRLLPCVWHGVAFPKTHNQRP